MLGAHRVTRHFVSVDKMARALTKWTRTCDRVSARFMSYTYLANLFKQSFIVANTAEQCRLRLFENSDFDGDTKALKLKHLRFWISEAKPIQRDLARQHGMLDNLEYTKPCGECSCMCSYVCISAP